MNFAQSLHYLDTLINYEKFSNYNYSRCYNLDRIRKLLFLLGRPQEKFPAVTIAGTKGKGSTVCMLGSILNASGIKAGIFVSPHLVSIRERIKVGTQRISEKAFACEISKIKNIIDVHRIKGITYFEAITSAAFLYFLREKVEIAILEVGLGGRLDAVNIAESSISAITPISHDHTHLLGRSLREIAKEKCGIIHNNSYVVSAKQEKQALDVINSITLKKNSRLFLLGRDIMVSNIKTSLSGTDFSLKTRYNSYRRLHTPLIGSYQASNASVAVCLAEAISSKQGFRISENDIKKGIRRVRFPGRFQVLSIKPYIILDGAQNKASAEALKGALKRIFNKKYISLILGVSSDKDYKQIAKNLCPLAKNVIFTQADSPRALPAKELARGAGNFSAKSFLCYDLKDSMDFAESITPKDGVIVITGSLFLAGEALRILGTDG